MMIGKYPNWLVGAMFVGLVGVLLLTILFPWGFPWERRRHRTRAVLGVYRTKVFVTLEKQGDVSFEDLIAMDREGGDYDFIEGDAFSNPKAIGQIYLLDGPDDNRVLFLNVGEKTATVHDRSGAYREISWEQAKSMALEKSSRGVSIIWRKDQ